MPVHYQIHNTEGRDTLVLLHGFPYSSAMWEEMIATKRIGWKVIAPDFPGAGKSPVISEKPELSDYANQIMEVVKKEKGPGKLVLAGFSMGGYVLLDLIERGLLDCDGYIFLNTKADGDTPEGKEGRQKAMDRIGSGDLKGFVSDFIPPTFSPVTKEKHPEWIQAWIDQASQFDPRGVAGALHAMKNRPDRNDLLARIDRPVLLVTGSDDALTGKKVMEKMETTIPRVKMGIAGEAGHMSPVEKPDVVAGFISEFLNGL